MELLLWKDVVSGRKLCTETANHLINADEADHLDETYERICNTSQLICDARGTG